MVKKAKVTLPPHAAKDDFHAFPRFVKGKHEVVDRSIMDVQHTGKSTRSAANVLWGKSTECLLYKKKIEPRPGAGAVRVTKGGNPIDKRPNRAFGAHTIRALASGAAAALGAEWKAQSELMRCKTNGEYERYPMLPAVTPGAALQMEVAGIAYAQEVVGVAMKLMKVGGHLKITPRCAQAACDIVNNKLNAGTGFMPPAICASFGKAKESKAKDGKDANDAKGAKGAKAAKAAAPN